MKSNQQIATFAAGCFWGVEANFRKLDGVMDTVVGYTGGALEEPKYEDVCRGNTGHAEAVRIIFNADIISYNSLLDTFWKIHDPTQLNKQGADIGKQYRSAIFFHSDKQRILAIESKKKLENNYEYKGKVKTEISKASKFWKAEDYHQRYLERGRSRL